MEFLSGDKAQSMYAEVNYEYPVKNGVKRSKRWLHLWEILRQTLSL